MLGPGLLGRCWDQERRAPGTESASNSSPAPISTSASPVVLPAAGPSDLQWMYEVGIRRLPPVINLLHTPAFYLLPRRHHKTFWDLMRTWYVRVSRLNRLSVLVIVATWAAPAALGRVLVPIAFVGCLPLITAATLLVNLDLLRLVMREHEFWFLLVTNVMNWSIAAILFNDVRILGCLAKFILAEFVVITDCNARTIVSSVRASVLWVPTMLTILLACGTRTADFDPGRFRRIIPENKINFTLANSFVNNNITIMIFVIRKFLRRKRVLTAEFHEDRMIPCSVVRCGLVLQRMQAGDIAGRARFETFRTASRTGDVEYELNVSNAIVERTASGRHTRVFAPVASTRSSRRTSGSTMSRRVSSIIGLDGGPRILSGTLGLPSPVQQPPLQQLPGRLGSGGVSPVASSSFTLSHPHASNSSRTSSAATAQTMRSFQRPKPQPRQQLRVVTPTLAFLDLRETVGPRWTPSQRLSPLRLLGLYSCGAVGLFLGGFTMYLPAESDPALAASATWWLPPRAIRRLIPVASFICTGAFSATFAMSYQRDLLRSLGRNFDFVFSSVQFTLGCACLADMMRWDLRCLALLSWLAWFHWVLLWDALLPPLRARFAFRTVHGTPVLVGILLGLTWIVYALLFSSYDGLRDRRLLEVDWGELHLSIRTSTFLIGRVSTTLTWSLRLVWRTLRADEDELILIRGALEYHMPLELFPVPRATKTLTTTSGPGLGLGLGFAHLEAMSEATSGRVATEQSAPRRQSRIAAAYQAPATDDAEPEQ